MWIRIAAIFVGIAVLLGLIGYSQIRSEPPRVSGMAEADEIRVGSRLGGRVASVHVEEGQAVSAGDVLVELEPYDLLQREQEARKTLRSLDAKYRALVAGFRPEEIAQAKAKFEQAKARLQLLKAGARPQEIAAARGRLEVARAELRLAEQDYQRIAQLFESQAVPESEFDAATERLVAAKASVVVRQNELALLEAGSRSEEIAQAEAQVEEARQAWLLAQHGYRPEEIEQAEAARDAAQAALEAIEQHKKELKILAPVDGIVEALDLQKGDLVPPGGPVMSLLDPRKMWIRAYVPQNRVGLKLGDRLSVSIDSLPGKRFFGHVSFIARQAEFTPNNVQTPEERSKQVFRIKVVVDNPPESLRPGMMTDVWLEPIQDES